MNNQQPLPKESPSTSTDDSRLVVPGAATTTAVGHGGVRPAPPKAASAAGVAAKANRSAPTNKLLKARKKATDDDRVARHDDASDTRDAAIGSETGSQAGAEDHEEGSSATLLAQADAALPADAAAFANAPYEATAAESAVSSDNGFMGMSKTTSLLALLGGVAVIGVAAAAGGGGSGGSDASSLTPAALTALTPQQIAALTPDQIRQLSTDNVALLNATQAAALTIEQLDLFTAVQIAAIRPASIAAMTGAQIASLSTAQLAALTAAQQAALTQAQIASLTAAQIASLVVQPIALSDLTPTRIAALTPSEAATLSALTFMAGTAFSSPLPTNAFTDPDRSAPFNKLSYSGMQTDHTALPAWISVDPLTGTINIGASAVGTTHVTITATDGGGLSASQTIDVIAASVPTLSSAINGAQHFDVTSKIVLTASEAVQLGTGTITFRDLGGTGVGGAAYGTENVDHTQTIAVNSSNVSIVGNKITIDLPFDIDLSSHYSIEAGAGAFTSTSSGFGTSAVTGSAITFDTIAPVGGTVQSSSMLSQSMDATGMHDSFYWWDITSVGSLTNAQPTNISLHPQSVASGPVALVFQDANTVAPALLSSGVTQTGQFNVRPIGLYLGDLIYIDDTANNLGAANDLTQLDMQTTIGHVNSIYIDPAIGGGSNGALITYTLPGMADASSALQLQTELFLTAGKPAGIISG